MPVLPTADALGPLPSGRSGSVIASFDTSAIGRSVADLGQAMEQGSAQLQQSWERNNAVNAESSWQKFHLDETQAYDDAVKNVQPGQANGFTQNYIDGYKQRAKAFLDTLPPQQRPAYEAKLMGVQSGIYTDAHRFETGEQTRAAGNAIDDGLQNGVLPRAELAARMPADDPRKAAALKQAEDDAVGLVEQNPYLTPIQKDEAKRKAREATQLRFGQALSPQEKIGLDPSPAATGSPSEASGAASAYLGRPVSQADYDLLLRAVHGESDGDPTESAMIAATILNRARDSGKSIHDVLYAPNQFQAVTGTANNGHQGNSNFVAGPSGAARAKIEGAIAGILPGVDHGQNDFTAANPKAYGPGTDVSYLRKMQAAGGVVIGGTIFNTGAPKAGASSSSDGSSAPPVVVGGKAIVQTGPAPSPYNLDALTLDQRVKLADQGRAELDKANTQQEKDQAAAIIQRKGTFDLAIETGDLTDPTVIRDDPYLKDADKATLLQRWETKNRDALDARAAVGRLASGDQFNPFNSADTKTADVAYNALGGADGLTTGDANSVARLRGVVDRTGVLPKSATEALQAGIYSTDKETRDASFTLLDGLYRSNRVAVERALPEADLKRLQDYQALAPVLTPDELTKRLDPTSDPRSDKIQEKLRDDGYKIADKVSIADIMNSGFDPSWLPGDQPYEPADPEQLQALKNDFNQAFADRYAVSGNEGVAKTQALQLLQQKWGASSVTGTKTLMAWPPEKYYPAVGGSYDWMAAQLKTEVAQQFPNAQNYHVVATAATEAQLKVGSPPYSVIVTDKDGVLRTFTAKFDPSVPINSARADFEKQQADALAAKATQALRRAAVTGATNPLATAAGAAINGGPPLIRPATTPSQAPAPAPSPNGLPSLGGPGTVLPPRQNPMRRDPRAGGFPVRQ